MLSKKIFNARENFSEAKDSFKADLKGSNCVKLSNELKQIEIVKRFFQCINTRESFSMLFLSFHLV